MKDTNNFLKKEVEKCFGKRIKVASDCEQLSIQILTVTDIKISWQTIRRFWGIVENKNKASQHTLNTLSQYIGYRDYSDFITQYGSQKTNAVVFDFSVVKKMFQNNTLYLNQYELWHETMTILLAEQIMNNRSFFESFVEHLGNNKGAMDYIIAGFQYYDLVNTDWFMRGFRTFCNNSKTLHHKLYLESIEYHAFILSQRQHEGEKYIQKMQTLLPRVRAKDGIVYPLEGAVYGCFIAHADYNKDEAQKEELLKEAARLCGEYNKDIFVDNRVEYHHIFIHTLVEILILAGLYREAEFFISHFEYKPNLKSVWKMSQINILNINKSMVYYQTGDYNLAKKYFDSINLDEKQIRFDRRTVTKLNYLLGQLAFAPRNAVVKRRKIKTEIETTANKMGMHIYKTRMVEFQ